MVLRFKSLDWFELKGRGSVASVTVPSDMPSPLGKEVQIDGVSYRCIGLERFGTNLGNPLLKRGEKVGLLVETPLRMILAPLNVTDNRKPCPKCNQPADLIADALHAEAPRDVWECPSCHYQWSAD